MTELEELRNFVKYIANDYYELSQEKVRIQRDDYIRLARDLEVKYDMIQSFSAPFDDDF